jgi:hypothetical protein
MSQKLSYTNHTVGDIRLTVEPGAKVYVVRPGHQVEIALSGGNPGEFLEMEQLDDGLTIYGYAGCVIAVRLHGEKLEPESGE